MKELNEQTSNYVGEQYATKAELNQEAKIRANADLELNAIKTDFPYVDSQLVMKQNKVDNSLTTTNKTVVGAINEINAKIIELIKNINA